MNKLTPQEREQRRIAANARQREPDRKDAKIAWAKAKRQRLRLELFARYGGMCVCCGVTDYRWLSLDHINRDGGIERNHQKVNAANRIIQLHRQPKRDDLQLLCYNCHLAKDFFGVCPHLDPSSRYYAPFFIDVRQDNA